MHRNVRMLVFAGQALWASGVGLGCVAIPMFLRCLSLRLFREPGVLTLRALGKGLELCGQKSFLEKLAPKISRVLTAWFPQEADSMWSGRKLCAGCWRLHLGPQDDSYSPHNDEGTKKRSNLTRSI